MKKARAEKSPRAEVLLRLREIETLCLRVSETAEHMSLRTVGHVLNDVMLALQGAQDPVLLLTVVATLARRRAEGMLLQRVEVWRGMLPV